MFYDPKPYATTLLWDDIFESPQDFIEKVEDVGGITSADDLTELYKILSFKYVSAHTRYTNEFSFIKAIQRELYTEFPFYLKKKGLADEMMAMEIAEIQLGARQLRNLVDTHDEPIVDADTKPFNDLSTQQEYIRVTNNKLDAVKQKYNVMNRNYLQGIYQRCDDLFRVILAEDIRNLYPQGEDL